MTNRFLAENPRCAQYLANVGSFYKGGIPFKGCKTFCKQAANMERCDVLVGIRKKEASFRDACVISLQRPVVSSGTTCDNTNKKTMQFTAANVHHNCLYVAGLGPAHDEIWTCDLTTGWTKCAHMLIGRRRHCTTFVGNDLFSLGGHDDSQTILEVESFNITENAYKMRRFLNYEVRNAACLALKGIIYVFGGIDREKKDILNVQMYDTQRDTCTTLERQMPCEPCTFRGSLSGARGYFWSDRMRVYSTTSITGSGAIDRSSRRPSDISVWSSKTNACT